jgi:hypothetical protein
MEDIRKAVSDPGLSTKQAPMARKKKMRKRMEVSNSEGEKTQRFLRKVRGRDVGKKDSFKGSNGGYFSIARSSQKVHRSLKSLVSL